MPDVAAVILRPHSNKKDLALLPSGLSDYNAIGTNT